jgi:hypothetical protein
MHLASIALPLSSPTQNDRAKIRFCSIVPIAKTVVTRGSRTLNIPVPIRYRSLAGLTRNNFRSARCDHPSLTFALMPSAPSRKRTARTDRPRRCAILDTGSYPAQFNKRSSSAEIQGRDLWQEPDRELSDFGTNFFGGHEESPAITEVLLSCRMRRQQSPRFHSGTSCRTLLIASCFPAGPSFSPATKTLSITGRNRGLILDWVLLTVGLADMARRSQWAGVNWPWAGTVHSFVGLRQEA